MIATVRNGGTCGCPRCTIPKCEFDNAGMSEDRRKRQELKRDAQTQAKLVRDAHTMVFEKKRAITNKGVESLLRPDSWTPVIVCFPFLQMP
jgi:hypothetical protein